MPVRVTTLIIYELHSISVDPMLIKLGQTFDVLSAVDKKKVEHNL